VLWAASAVPMVLLARHALAPADRVYLDAYWSAAFPHSLHDLVREIRDLFVDALPTPLPVAAVLVAGVGVVAVWRVARPLALLLILPLVAVLGALFLAPPVWAMRHDTSFHREELRPVMQALAAQRRPGDAIYVYYAAEPAFRAYAERTGVPLFGAVIGSCARGDWRHYVSELDRLRGRPRVWVVASHLYHGRLDEDSLFTQYLRVIGHGAPLRAFANLDAWARLYDLSDTSAVVAFRPMLTNQPPAPAYSCGPPAP
jgi:hypothetical protein